MIWLKLLLLTNTAFSSELPCSELSSRALTQISGQINRSLCLDQCHAHFKKNPLAKVSDNGICLDAGQRLSLAAKSLNPVSQAALILSCASGAWDGILTVDDQGRVYIQQASNIIKKSDEQKAFLKNCNAKIQCKVGFARFSDRFAKKDKTGAYVVSDAQLLSQIKSRTMEDLVSNANDFKLERQRQCGNLLNQTQERISQELNRPPQLPANQKLQQLQKRVFQSLKESSGDCVDWIKMKDPNSEFPSAENFFSKIGVQLQCLDQERATKLLCTYLGASLVDPINLVAASVGIAAKIVKVARLAKSESEITETLKEILPSRNPQESTVARSLRQNQICGLKDLACVGLVEKDLEILSTAQRQTFLKNVEELKATPEQKVFLIHYYSNRLKKSGGILKADSTHFESYTKQSLQKGLQTLQDNQISASFLGRMISQMDGGVIGSLAEGRMFPALREVMNTADSSWKRFGASFTSGRYDPVTNHLSGGHTFEALQAKDGILQTLTTRQRASLVTQMSKPNRTGSFDIKVGGQSQKVAWQTDVQGVLELKYSAKDASGKTVSEVKTLLPQAMTTEEARLLYTEAIARFRFGRFGDSKVVDVHHGGFCIRMLFDGPVIREGSATQHGHPVGSC